MSVAVVHSVDALRDQVLDAGARNAHLGIVGQGHWMNAGRPRRGTETVSVRDLRGITQYVPGDLTLTANAGTTLAEIREATAARGQWLALDPHGSDQGTLGATVATASSGPLAGAFGTPRDLVLGVQFVMGTGVVARGGGRVVKNVAGFDLTRLIVGSWGTLGIITEISVRLHARPAADETFAIAFDGEDGIGRVRRALRRFPFTPYACEIVNDRLALALLGSERPTALFRLGGNTASVQAQRSALLELGMPREIDGQIWQQLRQSQPERAAVFRMLRSPSDVQQTWNDASAIAARCPGTLLHASPTRGVVRCIVPMNATAIESLYRAFAAGMTAKRIGEQLPAELWPIVSPRAKDAIAAGIKRAFDPSDVLNAGVFFDDAA